MAMWTGFAGSVSSVKYAISVITSLALSEVIVFYRDFDFHGAKDRSRTPPAFFEPSQTNRPEVVAYNRRLFVLFRREMHKARNLKLVLCADVWDYLVEHAVRELKLAVAAEKAEGRLDDFPSEALVTGDLQSTGVPSYL